jgi:hypothetical protein
MPSKGHIWAQLQQLLNPSDSLPIPTLEALLRLEPGHKQATAPSYQPLACRLSHEGWEQVVRTLLL